MILNLTDVSDEPLQAQITRQIRAKILNGELSAGEALPSIRGLARNSRVSVITVQRAYEVLEREALIYARRGKGFFIPELKRERKQEMAKERFNQNIKPFLKAALEEGLSKDELLKLIQQMVAKLNPIR